MNQFVTLDKNIQKSPKRQDFGYFSARPHMPKTIEERDAEFELERKKLEADKQAFARMKADSDKEEVQVSPTVKRRRKAKEGV